MTRPAPAAEAIPASVALLAAHLARTHARVELHDCTADAQEIVRLASVTRPSATVAGKFRALAQKYRADIVRGRTGRGSVDLRFCGAPYRDAAGCGYLPIIAKI